MFKLCCMILLLGHVLGDFYLQTEEMARRKEESAKWLMLHNFLYFMIMIICTILIAKESMIFVALSIGVLHAVIDSVKYEYLLQKKKKRKKTVFVERNVFIIDQMLHAFCIVGVSTYYIYNGGKIIVWKVLDDLTQITAVPYQQVLYWIVAILLLHKPANILIQKLLAPYKREISDQTIKKDNNAGRLIGTLERLTMVLFLAIGQYVSIGLVMTAKSIARYDRISKEQDFAEYYLLGTLLSIVSVVLISFLL